MFNDIMVTLVIHTIFIVNHNTNILEQYVKYYHTSNMIVRGSSEWNEICNYKLILRCAIE